MRRRRKQDAAELDRIADTLHSIQDELHAEADETPDPVAQHRRANQISVNAEKFRERARKLRRQATDEDQ